MYPPTLVVEAPTLATAWQKLVKEVMRNGIILPTEYGPRSKDACSVTTITFPYAEPALHPSFPTKEDHLIEYCKQFDRDFDWKKQMIIIMDIGQMVVFQKVLIGVKIDINI